MAASGGNNPVNQRTLQSLEGKWLDFYALLDMSPDTDAEAVRKKISSTYADASANSDHRDLNRRYYYQALMERVLPQCRRILLDPELRARYDEQQRLHQAGDPHAQDFVTFMANLQNSSKDAAGNPVQGITDNEFDSLPERVRDEISLARSVVEAVQSGSEFDLLPSASLSDLSTTSVPSPSVPSPVSTPQNAPTPIVEAPPIETPAARPAESEIYVETSPGPAEAIVDEGDRRSAAPPPAISTQPASAAQPAMPVAQPPVIQPSVAPPPVTQQPPVAPAPATPVVRSEPRAQVQLAPGAEGAAVPQRSPEEMRAAAIADSNNLNLQRQKKRSDGYSPRVVVEDDEPQQSRGNGGPQGSSTQGKRILSPLSINILTAIVSAMLIFTILHFTDNSNTVERLPVRIVYAAELKPVLEFAQAEYAKTPAGQNIDLGLQPMDSRLAMRYILSDEGSTPDAWIPAESIWNRRFNQVAGKYHHREIAVNSPLALSPLVLIARGDKAAALKNRFPNRRIPSWEALRTAVAQDCAGHFGMTNPEEAGSGAISRYFMAHEWCVRNKVPWNSKAVTDPRLWQWLGSFENNVAGYKATTDMVNDLVLGTSGLYWWCLAYESEAINWIGKGEAVEVFYLPETYYADHPFCHIERKGAPREVSNALTGFERYLRSDSMQQALLKSGFRPTQIRLQSKVNGNPFTTARFADHGIAASGFNVTARLDYRIANNLTAAWSSHYGS